MGQNTSDIQVRTRSPKGLDPQKWREIIKTAARDNDMHEWQMITYALLRVPSIAKLVRLAKENEK